MSHLLAGSVLLACVLLVVVGRALLARAYPGEPVPSGSPGTPAYRADRLAYEPPRDGALLGFVHPLGWPVRIVQGIPVAVGPDGRAAQWSRTLTGWTHCYSDLAAEARSRLQLEETRTDDPLPPAVVKVFEGPDGVKDIFVLGNGSAARAANWVPGLQAPPADAVRKADFDALCASFNELVKSNLGAIETPPKPAKRRREVRQVFEDGVKVSESITEGPA